MGIKRHIRFSDGLYVMMKDMWRMERERISREKYRTQKSLTFTGFINIALRDWVDGGDYGRELRERYDSILELRREERRLRRERENTDDDW